MNSYLEYCVVAVQQAVCDIQIKNLSEKRNSYLKHCVVTVQQAVCDIQIVFVDKFLQYHAKHTNNSERNKQKKLHIM